MWSKKWLHAGLALLLSISLLTACGGETSGDSGTVTLTFWNGFTGPDGKNMKEIVDQFNKEHKGKIHVKMEAIPWDNFYDKIRTVVASGKAPDVAAMHLDQVPRMANKGVLTPLDGHLEKVDLKKEDFLPEVWEAGVYEDKRYGIPLDVHPIGLYYNVELLKEAGFDKPPTNLKEFLEVAKATTKDTDGDGKIDQWGFGMPTLWPAQMIFFSNLHQFGGEAVSSDGTKALYNSEEGEKTLQLMKDMIFKYKVSPKNIQQDGENTLFRQGKMAMHINGIWMINGLKEQKGLKFAAAPLPQFGDQKATWASSHNLVLPKQRDEDPKKTEAAMTFVDYVTENSLAWAKAGQIPARNSVRESDEFKALKEQSQFAKQVDYLKFHNPTPTFVDVWSPTEQAINKVLLGQKEPEEALNQAAKKGEKMAEAQK
ncbi:multiple sugar transport system substrate-binding protein [Melghirimyces profundicolus]|uniref:Multiple sugar transport system substrate-binding protein n=1 Tax=Melghirimyces profundicolus TaxID=1242148 RepID=A0A2T6C817_9BACL|nr:ABC transporter substrate-binding protein [Melghirimyces profundicolus]PTX64433.1 multiple sugar transport system substrate-binding protein [Melghirimyces profundicolus]